MSKFREHLDKALGLEGAAQMIADEGVNAVIAELKKRGQVAKENQGDAAEHEHTPAAEPSPELMEVVNKVVDEAFAAIDEHETSIEAVNKSLVERGKTAEAQTDLIQKQGDRIKTLETTLEALQKQVAEFLADTPRRASESAETAVSAKEAQELASSRVEYDPQYPGMNVPLKKES